MQPHACHFTVCVKPIPRGIDRNDLVSHHLSKFGQIKEIRFGSGRGIAGDAMFVDYFSSESALAAVHALNGTKDPGMSNLKLSVSLTPTSQEALRREEKRKLEEIPLKSELPKEPDAVQRGVVYPKRMKGAFKYLRPKEGGVEMCVIDFKTLYTGSNS